MSSSLSPVVTTVVTPQLLEQWVLQSNRPNDAWLPATQSLQHWRSTTPAVHCVDLLLQLLQGTQHPAVQLYALTVCGQLLLPKQAPSSSSSSSSQQNLNIMEHQIVALRSYLLHPPTAVGGDGGGVPPFLRNKRALLLAQLIWRHAATNATSWSTLESDLLQHLSVQQPTLFLKTVETLLEDVLSLDTTDNYDSSNNNNNQYSYQDEKESHHKVKEYLKGYDNRAIHVTASDKNNSSSSLLQRLFDRTVQLLGQAVTGHPAGSIHNIVGVDKEGGAVTILLCLETLRRFFQWMDLLDTTTTTTTAAAGSTTATTSTTLPEALQWVSQCLQHPQPDICVAALGVWHEWIVSMSSVSTVPPPISAHAHSDACDSINNNNNNKWPILSVGLLQHIHQTNLLPYEGESTADIHVVIQVASLVKTAGLHFLNRHGQDDATATTTVWHQLLDLFFRAFAYDDIDVSTAVLPLAAQLAAEMEHEQAATAAAAPDQNNMKQHLPQLLNTLYRQMKYPADFLFNHQDETDAEEIVYRTELSKLFTKFVRAADSVCLQFLCEAAHQLLCNDTNSSLAQAPAPDVQAWLSLVYHYCEGIRPAPGMKTALQNETFCAMLVALHASDIAYHAHEQVVCLYYETAVRYYPIYQQSHATTTAEPSLLARLLQAMSGTAGLQHPTSSRIRSRCCYLLLRLVKSVIKQLRPFVETAVTGIYSLLSNTTPLSSNGQESSLSLRPDDMLYLFETMGLLLGKTGLPATDQQRYLTQVMTPHVRSIEERLALPDLALDEEGHGAVLAASVAAMVHLSKGFSVPPEEVKLVLVETVQITLTVLEALPRSEAVRNKAMVILQRMILCVGNKVLPQVPRYLFLLIEHCTEEDILFVSQLMNQLCMKFKGEAAPVLDGALLPFLRKCHSLVPTTEDVAGGDASDSIIPPHLQTEQLVIQKLAFVVLQHIVTNDADAVLVSLTNVGSLESILQTVGDGAIHVRDPIVKKTCLKFFRDLLGSWVTAVDNNSNGNNNSPNHGHVQDIYRQGLLAFCTQHLVPGMFACLFQKSFDELDAGNARVVHEFAHVLFSIQTHYISYSNTSALYQQCIVNSLQSATTPTAVVTASVPQQQQQLLQVPAVVAALGGAKNPTEVQTWLTSLLEQVKRRGGGMS